MKIPRKLQQYIIDTQTVPLNGAPIFIKILAFAYKLLGRKLTAKLLVASNQCNACDVCVKKCPNNAITLWLGNPHRSKKCKGCLYCVYVCPKCAVELPISVLLGSFLLIFLPYDEWIVQLIPSDLISNLSGVIHSIFLFFLWCIGYAIAVYFFNKIGFLLHMIPFVKKIGAIPFVKKIRYKIHPALIFPIFAPRNLSELKK